MPPREGSAVRTPVTAHPIQLTIPTDHPWVPLRILGLGLDPDRLVQADVFLLTDARAAAPGRPHRPRRSSGASRRRQSLLDDLRSDKNMSWVPGSEWLSYLNVDATAGDLHYDLATSVDGHHRRRSSRPG